jgi:hypothetical protein
MKAASQAPLRLDSRRLHPEMLILVVELELSQMVGIFPLAL